MISAILGALSGIVGLVLGLLHLIVVVWALFKIFKSNASTGSKVLWALIVFFFPVVGLLAWLFFGPG